MNFMRFLLTFIVLGLIPLTGSAQTRPSSCGSISEAVASVEDYAPYFSATEFANVRGSHISQIASSDPQYIVTDSVTCQAVHDKAVALLAQNGGSMVDLLDHDFTVFRFGSYFAIILLDNATENSSSITTKFAPLMVFQASDLSYVFTILT